MFKKLGKLAVMGMAVMSLGLGTVVGAQGDVKDDLVKLSWVKDLQNTDQFEVKLGAKVNMSGDELSDIGVMTLKVKSPIKFNETDPVKINSALNNSLIVSNVQMIVGVESTYALKDGKVYVSTDGTKDLVYSDDMTVREKSPDDSSALTEEDTTKLLDSMVKLFDYVEFTDTDSGLEVDVLANKEGISNFLDKELIPTIKELDLESIQVTEDLGVEGIRQELDTMLAGLEDFKLNFTDTGITATFGVINGDVVVNMALTFEVVSTSDVNFDEYNFIDEADKSTDEADEAATETTEESSN